MANGKVLVAGLDTENGVLISDGDNQYAAHKALENVVDIVPAAYSFTALISSNGNCDTGCEVTTFG